MQKQLRLNALTEKLGITQFTVMPEVRWPRTVDQPRTTHNCKGTCNSFESTNFCRHGLVAHQNHDIQPILLLAILYNTGFINAQQQIAKNDTCIIFFCIWWTKKII